MPAFAVVEDGGSLIAKYQGYVVALDNDEAYSILKIVRRAIARILYAEQRRILDGLPEVQEADPITGEALVRRMPAGEPAGAFKWPTAGGAAAGVYGVPEAAGPAGEEAVPEMPSDQADAQPPTPEA